MTAYIIIQLCISYLAIGFLVDVIMLKTGFASTFEDTGFLIVTVFAWPITGVAAGIAGIIYLLSKLLQYVEDGDKNEKKLEDDLNTVSKVCDEVSKLKQFYEDIGTFPASHHSELYALIKSIENDKRK